MDRALGMIILFLVLIIVICVANTYEEGFRNDYYNWNWNDPDLIKNINYANLHPEFNCIYSVSCDLSDDAQPFCYKSCDIPQYDKENNLMINNSY